VLDQRNYDRREMPLFGVVFLFLCALCVCVLLCHSFVQGGPKNLAQFFLYALTLPNINRFSKLFHCQNREKICNNTVAKDPTTPQVFRYSTL